MTESSKKILMLGLPETGKTSFLAAFMHFVETPSENKRFFQHKLSPNAAYLTSIVQNWLKGNKPERTKITATKNSSTVAEIFLQDKNSGEQFTLYIPDFFGETFENQFFDRHIEIEYLEQIRTSSGVLLFIHPERIKLPLLIEDIQLGRKTADLIDAEFENEGKSEGMEGENSKVAEVQVQVLQEVEPFKVEESPTQLIIVDLLESHLEFSIMKPMGLALVISAWDVVRKDNPDISPLKWVEINMPLLYQFLSANEEAFRYKTFGISAEGGDLKNADEFERLTGLNHPSERIVVQEGETVTNNITSPIEWLIKNDETK